MPSAGSQAGAAESGPRRSGEQRHGLDLGMHRQAGADVQPGRRALGDAGEQGGAFGIEPDQHMARGVGRRQVDDSGRHAVQDARLGLRHQRQADIAGVNAAAQRGADGLGAVRYENGTAGEFEPGEIVGLVRGDPGVENDARIVGKGGRQVDAAEYAIEWAAGDDPAVVEQNQVVGQAGHFIRRMADVDDRNGQFAMQAFQVGEDFQLALEVERGQRFVHEQDLRCSEQGAGDGDTLAFAAGELLRPALQQVRDAEQFGHLRQG